MRDDATTLLNEKNKNMKEECDQTTKTSERSKTKKQLKNKTPRIKCIDEDENNEDLRVVNLTETPKDWISSTVVQRGFHCVERRKELLALSLREPHDFMQPKFSFPDTLRSSYEPNGKQQWQTNVEINNSKPVLIQHLSEDEINVVQQAVQKQLRAEQKRSSTADSTKKRNHMYNRRRQKNLQSARLGISSQQKHDTDNELETLNVPKLPPNVGINHTCFVCVTRTVRTDNTTNSTNQMTRAMSDRRNFVLRHCRYHISNKTLADSITARNLVAAQKIRKKRNNDPEKKWFQGEIKKAEKTWDFLRQKFDDDEEKIMEYSKILRQGEAAVEYRKKEKQKKKIRDRRISKMHRQSSILLLQALHRQQLAFNYMYRHDQKYNTEL